MSKFSVNQRLLKRKFWNIHSKLIFLYLYKITNFQQYEVVLKAKHQKAEISCLVLILVSFIVFFLLNLTTFFILNFRPSRRDVDFSYTCSNLF